MKKIMKIKFYDTSSLLKQVDTLFETEDLIAISSITLEELENIKTSSNKDADIKYSARKLLHILDDNTDNYEVVIFKDKYLKPIVKTGISINNDMKILSCAIELNKKYEVQFVTNDLALKHIALLFFDNVYCVAEEVDEYCGFRDFTFNTQDSIAEFYENINENCLSLLPNEYAILRDSSGAVIDRVCWTGETHRPLKFQTFSSKWFNVKPMKGDIYQQFVADSFLNNKITMVKGPAGSGKTLMSLGFLFD